MYSHTGMDYVGTIRDDDAGGLVLDIALHTLPEDANYIAWCSRHVAALLAVAEFAREMAGIIGRAESGLRTADLHYAGIGDLAQTVRRARELGLLPEEGHDG